MLRRCYSRLSGARYSGWRPAKRLDDILATCRSIIRIVASGGATVYQMLCVLLATIAYGSAAGHCQATTITFQSSPSSDFRQLLTREAPAGTVTVRATLEFPEAAKEAAK